MSEVNGKPKNAGYWTFERCKEEALKYESMSEFKKNSGGAYKASCKNKWHDEVCGHICKITKPHGYWTIAKCKEEALKYDSRKEFAHKSGGAYNFAKKT